MVTEKIYNLFAELCAFIGQTQTDNYLIRYSCISDKEQKRISDKIMSNAPFSHLKDPVLTSLREEDLTGDFLEELRAFAGKLIAQNDRNCIMKVLQTLDEALFRILENTTSGVTEAAIMRPLNSNWRYIGIELFPRCRCVWARKSRQYFSERRIDNCLKHFIVVEKKRVACIEEHHIFLPKGFFPQFDRKGFLKVAASPVSAQSDFEVLFHCHHAFQTFSLDYDRSLSDRAHDLIWKKIIQAGKGNAELIVFPEMLGTPDMEDVIRARLQALPPGEQEKLPALIVLPTVFIEGQNYASILDRHGDLLARQYKQNPYIMEHAGESYMENITGSNEVIIFHYPGIGRFTVMICKDFLTTRYMERLMRSFKLTLIIVPAYSTGAYDFRTSFETCAHDYCNVVWINSCAAMVPEKEDNFRYIGYVRKRITRYQMPSDAHFEMKPCRGLFKGECAENCLYFAKFGKVYGDG